MLSKKYYLNTFSSLKIEKFVQAFPWIGGDLQTIRDTFCFDINSLNKIYGNDINYKLSERRKGDVEKLVSNIDKLEKHIDWEPKYNDLSTIIKSSIDWEKKLNEEIL